MVIKKKRNNETIKPVTRYIFDNVISPRSFAYIPFKMKMIMKQSVECVLVVNLVVIIYFFFHTFFWMCKKIKDFNHWKKIPRNSTHSRSSHIGGILCVCFFCLKLRFVWVWVVVVMIGISCIYDISCVYIFAIMFYFLFCFFLVYLLPLIQTEFFFNVKLSNAYYFLL